MKTESAESKLSRERFEKWCPIKIVDGRKAPTASALEEAYWTAWQAAEKDTREQCAQQLTEIAEQSSSLSLRRHMRQGSERIRGKE